MKKLFTLTFLLTLIATISFAQGIEPLKLTEEEVSEDYERTENILCKSIQAALFYKSPEMYSMILGDLVEKGYQSYEKKGDKGTVLYFIFDQDITDNAFIPGLLWGSVGKPTKAHPEEYIAKGNTLVIWSFDKSSTLKKLSKEKVAKVL
jgi:hypothetical protein